MHFNGTRIGFYGLGRPDGGYAQIELLDGKGKKVLSSVVDMYAKYPVSSLKFISPRLPKGAYTLQVTVLGENWYWVNKSGNRSGSKGYGVSLDKLVIDE